MVTWSTPASSHHCFWNWAMVEVGVVVRRGQGQLQRAGVVGLVGGDQALGLVHVLLLRVAGVLQVADLVPGENGPLAIWKTPCVDGL